MENKTRFFILIILLFVLVLSSRLYPLLKFGEGALGYDTGFYRAYLETPSEKFLKPTAPLLEKDAFGARFILNLLSYLRIPTNYALFGSYILFSLFLGLSIYFLTAQIFCNRIAGLFALFLYSISPVQWLAYSFMFYKQILAVSFFFFAVYLIERRSYFFILPLIFSLASHRTTSLLVIPSLFLYAILLFFKKRNIRAILIIFAGITLGIWINWQWITALFTITKSGLPFLDPFNLKTGIFIGLDRYLGLSLLYIFAGILGLGPLIKNRRFNVFFFFFLLSAILVLIQSYFYQRLIIFLDLSLIILSGGALNYILSEFRDYKYIIKPLICAFFLIAGIIFFLTLKNYQPLISQKEILEIANLRQIENNAYIMTFSSEYAPWLYGWAGPGKKIISPGLFWDKWNYEQWNDFWSADLEKQKQMLASFRAPIYIFHPAGGHQKGENLEQDHKYENDKCFQKFSASIQKFNCY